MDEVLDVRPYLESLRKNLLRIGVASLSLALLALIASLLWPKTYEATALVIVRQPGQLLQFDPRFETLDGEPSPLAAYPELALSDGVVQTLWDERGNGLAALETVTELREQMGAVSGVDPSLLRLSVRFRDPETASLLANRWADLFISQTNQLLGVQDQSQLAFFEEQRDAALKALDAAEAALIDYQSTNRGIVVNSELTSLQSLYGQYLEDTRKIDFLAQDVDRLRAQVEAETNSEATLGDQLTVLLLQVKVYNADTNLPLELQLAGIEEVSGQSRQEQAIFLNNLLTVLDERQATAETRLAEIEPDILALQAAFQGYGTEYGRLERNKTVAEETYMALARQVDQERIIAADTSAGLRLASQAAVPDKPVSPRIGLNTLIGALIGLVTAGFIVLFQVWWHQEPARLEELHE